MRKMEDKQIYVDTRATGCFGLGQRNERDTLVTSSNFKIMNTQFQKKGGRRWTWRSPDGIQTDPEEVPPIMAWEVKARLRKMKDGKEAGKDQTNIETLKAGDETIVKQLAKLYTKCITERHIHETEKCDNPTEEFHTFTI